MAWEIDERGSFQEKNRSWELSVMDRDATEYDFLKSTWGWGCESKIILFSTGIGNNNPPESRDTALRIAKILCVGLNDSEEAANAPIG